MSWTAKDVAKMAARLEAAGVRQAPEVYAAIRESAAIPAEGEGRGSKYANEKAEADGIVFHSKLERDQYLELKLRERAGDVRNLRRQVRFLVSETTDGDKEYYVADFTYEETPDWKLVAHDSKGFQTREFQRKAKRFRRRYPEIELRIVER